VFNEVSQTLSKALTGKFDLIDRRNDPKSDLEYVDDDDDNDAYEDDDDEDDSDVRFHPTLPPIYPAIKSKPESRSLKRLVL
jgi:hypothetical protein